MNSAFVSGEAFGRVVHRRTRGTLYLPLQTEVLSERSPPCHRVDFAGQLTRKLPRFYILKPSNPHHLSSQPLNLEPLNPEPLNLEPETLPHPPHDQTDPATHDHGSLQPTALLFHQSNARECP